MMAFELRRLRPRAARYIRWNTTISAMLFSCAAGVSISAEILGFQTEPIASISNVELDAAAIGSWPPLVFFGIQPKLPAQTMDVGIAARVVFFSDSTTPPWASPSSSPQTVRMNFVNDTFETTPTTGVR